MEKNFKELLREVKAFTFDVDGVFTNNSVLLYPGGEPVRVMNVKDGYAVQQAVKQGYPVAIITGGRSEAVRQRFLNLGVQDIFLGAADKVDALEMFLAGRGLDAKHILHMGDDLPDYGVMQRVLLPTCPHDSAEEIKAISAYVSDKKGGEGCVRDIIEQVLKVQGKWYDAGAHEETKDALKW